VVAAGSAVAFAAQAAPTVELRGLAARVTVIPESRRDIAVAMARPDPRLPVQVRRFGDHVYVFGDVARRVHGCRTPQGGRVVSVWGRPPFPLEQLPQIVIRTPLDVRLTAGDAVFGDIQRSASVDFVNKGCGDWTVADVQGRLRLSQAGAGDARVGSAGSGDLSVAGSGGVSTGEVRGGLTAISSGSGDITVAGVSGPVDARVAGPGNITLASGSVGAMSASIAGSGAVTLHGVAASLRASIAGTGDVSVDRVTGPVVKQIFGSGVVRVGRQRASRSDTPPAR
jgi:hypothetical protein